MKFSYKAIDADGKTVSGTESADNQFELVKLLKGRGFAVLDVKAEEGKDDDGPPAPRAFNFEPFGISPRHVAFFTRQLAELTDSGIPLVESLVSLQQLSPSQKFAGVVSEVTDDIQRGNGLRDSLARHPKVFSRVYLSLIGVGEKSGDLGAMVSRLADYLERDLEVRGKVKAALSYPAFILVFGIVLAYVGVAWILPSFEPMWQASGLDINDYPITVALMRISDFTHGLWDELLVIVLVGLVLFGLVKLLQTQQGREITDSVVYRLPPFSALVQLSVISRLSDALATMMKSGSPLEESLELGAQTAGNELVSKALREVSVGVQQGEELAALLRRAGVFPPLLIQMVHIGEKSGDLAGMLERISKYYRAQLESGLKAFTSLIEPVIMVLMGGAALVFVMGIFMPIMGVVTALHGQA